MYKNLECFEYNHLMGAFPRGIITKFPGFRDLTVVLLCMQFSNYITCLLLYHGVCLSPISGGLQLLIASESG